MCHIPYFSFKSIPFKCDILTQHSVSSSLLLFLPLCLFHYYFISIEFANKSVIPFSVEFILTICMMTNRTGNDNDVSQNSFGFCFWFRQARHNTLLPHGVHWALSNFVFFVSICATVEPHASLSPLSRGEVAEFLQRIGLQLGGSVYTHTLSALGTCLHSTRWHWLTCNRQTEW